MQNQPRRVLHGSLKQRSVNYLAENWTNNIV